MRGFNVPLGSEKALALIESIRNQISSNQEAMRRLRSEFGEASLAVENGEAKSADLKDGILRSLNESEAKERSLNAALEAAQVRYNLAIREDRAAENRRTWRKIREFAKQREDLAISIQERLAVVTGELNELVRLGEQMNSMVPAEAGKPANVDHLLGAQVLGQFRAYLRKLGWEWASRNPWADQLPEFRVYVKTAHDWLFSLQAPKDPGGGPVPPEPQL